MDEYKKYIMFSISLRMVMSFVLILMKLPLFLPIK